MKKITTISCVLIAGLICSANGSNETIKESDDFKRILSCVEGPEMLYKIGIACESPDDVMVGKNEADTNPFSRFLRGASNIISSPLEIVRCQFVDSQSCVVTGPSNALSRFSNGLFELITFGLYESAIYGDEFPSYIWNSSWRPKKESKESYPISKICFEKAAYKGHGEAQSKFGDYILKDANGSESNRIEAIKWYERAIKNGSRFAEEKLRKVTGF